VAVAVKGEPVLTPAGGGEGDPLVVASRVAFDPSLSEDRYQLAPEASPADSVAMVSPPLRPEKTPGKVSATAGASATAAANSLQGGKSSESEGQWSPEFSPSLDPSATVSDRSSPARSVARGVVATFDCAPRRGEGALLGGADGDDSLLLLQPPIALRPPVPVQAVDAGAFAAAAAASTSAAATPSSAAVEGREPNVGSPTFPKSLRQGQRSPWCEDADWNAALAGEPYRGVGDDAPGVGNDVAGAAGHGIAGDVNVETRGGSSGGGGGGGGPSGGTDDVLANPLLSSLRLKQARSVAMYGVTAAGKGQAPDSACSMAVAHRVANVNGAARAANAAGAAGATGATGATSAIGATGAAGSSADERTGGSPALAGVRGPHRDQWRGSAAASAPGQHLTALHRPANVVAAALGARLPSAGGALTRRLWDSRLAPREPNGGVEFASQRGNGAVNNIPCWQWGPTPAPPHPPLLQGPVAQRVTQPAFPPGPLSAADAPMFTASGGPAASALVAAATAAEAAVAAGTTPAPVAMTSAVMAPSSSPYLLSSSTPMSAGAASAAATSSAAARLLSANRGVRGGGGEGGREAP
ncbi:unnamed protein product, partial [Laminaria digitata]